MIFFHGTATRARHRELRGWRGPVVFASHDRAFLDEVATALVEDENLDAPSTGGAGFSSDASGAGTLADDESLAALREKLSGNV